MALIGGRQGKTVLHRTDALGHHKGASVPRFEPRTVIKGRQMFTAEPDFVADVVLRSSALRASIVFQFPLLPQDVGPRPIAELTKEFGHRRGGGRGQGTSDIHVGCAYRAMADHGESSVEEWG